MNTKLCRRWKIRLSSYFIVLIGVLSVFAVQNYIEAKKYYVRMENAYQRALGDLSDYVNNINISLKKGIYTNTSPMIAEIAISLWKESAGAKSSIGQLPISELHLENTYKFLSQVGEYALYLSRKSEEGDKITEQERQTMVQLCNLSENLSNHLFNMQYQINEENFSFQKIGSALSEELKNGMNYLSDQMNDTEQSMVDYPTLIYDGPFADQLLNRMPEMTQNQPEISKDNAKSIAAKYLGISIKDIRDGNDENGIMPSFGFISNSTTISITKNGGFLTSFRNTRNIGEIILNQEDAIRIAESYLNENGYPNMKESYYMVSDGECIINFAYIQDNTVLYPDLIKVGVALDNGEVVSFESRGFLMNHKQRILPSPNYTFEQAKSVLSPYLSVIDFRKALIPLPNGKEELCYEFHCKNEEENEVLVYVNTQTCKENQILLLLYLDNGILTK